MTSEDPQVAGTCQILIPTRGAGPLGELRSPSKGQKQHNRPIARGWLAAIGSRREAPRRLRRGAYPTKRRDIPSSPEGRRELANRPCRRWAVCRASRPAALL